MYAGLYSYSRGRGSKSRQHRSFYIGCDGGPCLVSYNLSRDKYLEILSRLPFEKRKAGTTRNPVVFPFLAGTADNVDIIAAAIFNKTSEELLWPFNGRIEKDRNGFYIIDSTFHRKRPRRKRFHQSLDPLLARLHSGEKFPRPITRFMRRCNCCGAEGATRDMWHWGYVAGLANSDYVCGCKSCGARIKAGPASALFTPIGAEPDGKLQVEEFWEGRPILPLNGQLRKGA